jgi:hypothetical protein
MYRICLRVTPAAAESRGQAAGTWQARLDMSHMIMIHEPVLTHEFEL